MSALGNPMPIDTHQPLRFGPGDEAADPLALALRRLQRATFVVDAAEDHFVALRGVELKHEVVLELCDLVAAELDAAYLALLSLTDRGKGER